MNSQTDRKVSPELARKLVIEHGSIIGAARATGFAYGNMYRAYNAFMNEENRYKVFVFSDTHVQRGVENDHLNWIGKRIKDTKPDFVVCNGDFADFNSLNGHDQNDTYKGKLKPSVKHDLEYMSDCMQMVNEAAGRSDFIFCEGNHEGKRLMRFENSNPELHDFIVPTYLDLIRKNKWQRIPFGRHYNLLGVDFVHCPINGRGQPVGGKTSLRNVAMYSLRDTVFSHTHCQGLVREAKYGNYEWTTAVNTGSSMPIGYIQEYAIDGMSGGWWHGVVELTIQHGKIQDASFITMQSLKEWYA